MRVQSYATSQVAPGSFANFVIWVWSTLAPSQGVVVNTKILSATNLGSPAFIICPASSGTQCTLGDVPVDQAYELEAVVEVPTSATIGEQFQLWAQALASTPGAIKFTSTATDVVTATTPSPSPSPITTPTTPAPTGSTLSPIPGTSVSPTNPAGLFPTVGASPSTGVNLPSARSALHANTTAANVPLDSRLLGGQIAGLAVLAAGIALAIARLSLRRQKAGDSTVAPKPPEK